MTVMTSGPEVTSTIVLKALFEEQKQHLDYFFEHLHLDAVEQLLRRTGETREGG